MIDIDFVQIAKQIDEKLYILTEDDFVYLLSPNPEKNGNIVFQVIEDGLVFWSNDYKSKSFSEIIMIILEVSSVPLIFPFIETEEEVQTIVSLRGEPINFESDNQDDFPDNYGSFIITQNEF